MFKIETANTKAGRIIFWTATSVLVLVFTAQYLSTDMYWLAFLDNLHWTTGSAAAAAMAGIGFSQSTGKERAARRWFFAGLVAYTTGQLLWDIQVYIGWNPFPAPSDFGYLLLGPGCLLGLVAAMRNTLPKHNHFVTALDATMLSISILALTLAIYLPKSASINLLTLGVMAAYPVALLTASCFGILMILHLRPHRNWSWITFQIALGLQGLIWMWWNLQALSSKTVDGSFLNELFSVASIIIGVSAMRWRMIPSDSEHYAKWCEGMLRMLPLGGVIIASIASVWVLSVDNVLPTIQNTVLLAAIAVIILATIRQMLTIKEHTQLLEAEKAIAESRSLLQIVVDTAPMRVFWKDCDLRYLGCNDEFARDAGMASDQDIIGKNDYEMIWKNQADSYRSDDLAVINSGVSKLSYIESFTTPQGQLIWVNTSKVPLRNSRNEIIGILGVYSDVTESISVHSNDEFTRTTINSVRIGAI